MQRSLRTLLVTSSVTFVPDNYNQLILKMAEHPSIVGLLVLKNHELAIPKKALALLISGLAPRTGFQLLKNYLGSSNKKRIDTYQKQGKKVWFLPTINCQEAIDLIQQQNIDLIVNARTRYIYKDNILNAPQLGCINIHHGLLPDQRGVMCDLWALSENTSFGFSIHKMTPKLDDGDILKVHKLNPISNNYLENIHIGSQQEGLILSDLLNQIQDQGTLQGIPNQSENVTYRKNPTLKEIISIKRKGILL